MVSGSSSRTARGGGEGDCVRDRRSSGARADGARAGACLRRSGGGGARVGVGTLAGLAVLLVMHGARAQPDETIYEASGSLASSPDQATLSTSLQPSGLLMIDENPAPVIHSDSTNRQRDMSEISLSSTAEKPQITLHLGSTVESPPHSSAEGPIKRAEPTFMIPATAVVHIRNQSSTSGLDFSTHTTTSFVRSLPQSHTVPPVATDIISSHSLPQSSASTVTPASISLLLPPLSSSDSTSLWSPLKKTKSARNHSHISSSVPVATTPTTLYSDEHRSLKNTLNDTYIQFNKHFVQNPFITTHLMASPTIHKNPTSPGYKSFLKQPTKQNVTSYLNLVEPYTNDNNVSLGSYRQYVTTQVTSLNSLLATDMTTVKSRLFPPVSFSGIHLSGSTEKPTLSNFLQKSVSFSEYTKPKKVFSTSSAFMKYMPSTSLHEISNDKTLKTHGIKEIAKFFWNVAPTNIPSAPLVVHRTDTISSETTARAVTLSKPLRSAIFSSATVKQVTDSLSRSMTSIQLDRKSFNSQNGIISNFVTTLDPEKGIQEASSPLHLTSSENPFSKTFTSAIASTSLPTPLQKRSFLKLSTFRKGSSDRSFSLIPSIHFPHLTQTNKADIEKSDDSRRMPTSPEIFSNIPFFSAQTKVSKDTFVEENTHTLSPKQKSALGTDAQVLNLTPIRANPNTAGKERSVDSGFYTTLTLKKQEVSTLSPAVIEGFSHRTHPLQQVHVIKPGESFLHVSTSNTNKSVSLNTGGVQELPARGPASAIDRLSKRTRSVSPPTTSVLAVHTSGTETDLPSGTMELLPASLPTELSSASSPLALLSSSLPATSPPELASVSSPSELPSEVSSVSSSKLSPASTVSSSRELSSATSPSKFSPALSPSSSSSSSPSSVASLLDTSTALSELSPVSTLVSSLKDLPTVSLPPELLPLSSSSEFLPSSPSPLTAQSLPPELPSASSTSEIPPAFSLTLITSTATSPSKVLLTSSSPSSSAALLSPSELSPSASSLSEIPPVSSPSSSIPSSPPELLPISSFLLSSVASSSSDVSIASLAIASLPSELSTGTSPFEPNLLHIELSAPSSSPSSVALLSHSSPPSELSPVSSASLLTLASSLSDLATASLPPELLPLSSTSEILPASSPLPLSALSLPLELPSTSSISEIPPAFLSLLASKVLPSSSSVALSSHLELSPLSSSPLSSVASSPSSAAAASKLSAVSLPSELSTGPSPSESDLLYTELSAASSSSSSSSDLSPILLLETSELLSISPTTTSSILIPFTSYYNSVLTKQLTSMVSVSPSSMLVSTSSPSKSLSSGLSPSESPQSELSLSELSPSEISPLEFSSPPSTELLPTELSAAALSPSTSSSKTLSLETSLLELSYASLPTEMSPGSSPPPTRSSSSLIKLSPELYAESSLSSDLAPELLSTASLLSELLPTWSVFESTPASELSPSPSQPSYYNFMLTKQLIPFMFVSPSKEILTSSSSLSPSSKSTSPVISSYYDFLLTKQFTSFSPSKISSSALSPFISSSSSAAYNYHSGLTKYSTLSPLTSITASDSPSTTLLFPLKSSLMASTSSEPMFSLPSKPSLTFSQISALIPSHLSQEVSEPHLVVTEKSTLDQVMSALPSFVLTSQDTRLHAKGNDSGSPSSQMISPTLINKNGNTSVHLELLTQELPVGDFTQLTTITTTTASTTTTTTQKSSTSQLTSTTGSTTSSTTTTTVKTPKTIAPTVSSKWPTTAPRVRTSPPRTTTTTQTSPLSCNITDRMWVKTVLTVHLRRNRLDNILKQNLLKGLTLALVKALNDSSVRAQIESLSTVPNVTVGYYVTRGDLVYTPSVVVEALISYGLDRLMADIRQFVPMVQAVPIPAIPWRSTPAISLMLKTVLRFVGVGDDMRSCSFAQLMEKRLENAFAEAEAKVLNSYSSLSVEILSVSQSSGSPAVSLIYVVRNRTVTLNGTVASNLLSRLTAELVGYFLFYPPLITAEPLEYHNLNTSVATKEFWVITVIQDVENSSLMGQYQSFASLMEEHLAELFMVAHQQGARFKRATTVGSYTVQMVGMRRVVGPKNPAELTYYVQLNGTPLPGTTAAKILNTVDSQTMALTLGYFVQLQAEAVVKGPSNNLWIIASVLAPIGIVTIIIIIITAVLCHKNKGDLKTDGIGNLNPRVKTSYRRDMSYYHQPVQGFDYAKQHLGQLGADEDSAPLPQAPLPIRDASLSLDKVIHPDGTNSKKILGGEIRKSSEDGSVGSVEVARLVSVRGSTAKKITTQQSLMKEESKKRTDPYDTSSGSLQLLSVKPIAGPPAYSQPASSDRSQDSAILNGEVNMALKQKSDIEHYRNKLRLKAKRKGYYDIPSAEGNASSKSQRQESDNPEHTPATRPSSRTPEYDEERSSTYVKSRRRHSEVKYPAYRSRQSLNSPSPGGTEMDLLVMRERPRKGIRNSGYDTEPEIIEETNVDSVAARRQFGYGKQVKGQSETSTLSSQPSIDEVRQQMHLLLEEAFSLASAGHTSSSRRNPYHQQHQAISPYSPGPSIPYPEEATSAPDTMNHAQRGLQWVPAYGHDLYQCSLGKPTFRFTQLPEMGTDSPPPPVPPRTGPVPRSSLQRSTPDLGPKAHSSESSVPDMQQSQQDSSTYVPVSRAPLPPVTTEPLPNHSGNPMTAVYAIPTSRPGYPGYFISTPPSSYHSPSWMSYPPEPEDVSSPWTESVPLPGYAEAFPNPRYPRGSPFPWNPSQAVSHPQTEPDQPFSLSNEHVDVITPITLSTSALVQAIRDEVAKLAKKQADMFEFQV